MTELEQLKKDNARLAGALQIIANQDGDIYPYAVAEEALAETSTKSLREIKLEAIDSEEHNIWKRAVIDQLVVSNILSEVHYNDPEKAIKDLLVFESEIAIDPRISKAAIDLRREAMEKAIDKACNRLKLFGFGEPGNDDPVVLIRNMPLPLEDE